MRAMFNNNNRQGCLVRCLTLYTIVLGVVGGIVMITWIASHLYVLTLTQEGSLKIQRWVDILLGVCSFSSLVVLEYGAFKQEKKKILVFCIINVIVLVLYWCWFLYLRIYLSEREASAEVYYENIFRMNRLMSCSTNCLLIRCLKLA